MVVDGIFGVATEEAVKNFQKSSGLTVDGIVGPQTWERLELIDV
ncbi:peptidoglycan-binding domain-containing protein [Dapis sp. BLCC M229]